MTLFGSRVFADVIKVTQMRGAFTPVTGDLTRREDFRDTRMTPKNAGLEVTEQTPGWCSCEPGGPAAARRRERQGRTLPCSLQRERGPPNTRGLGV